MIHEEIRKAVIDFEAKTGVMPSIVYLGDIQIKDLLEFAYENDYISDPKKQDIKGDNRPEVLGLIVYVVNEDNYLAVSV